VSEKYEFIDAECAALPANTTYLRVWRSWCGSDLLFRGVLEMRRAPW
jgi:hypothetical protein